MAELHGTRDLDEILMTIYWFVDDFLASSLKMLKPAIEERAKITNKNPPMKQRKLSLSEIVTLGIFRFYVGTTNWKDFYWHIQTYHGRDFPDLPCYSKFPIIVGAWLPISSSSFLNLNLPLILY